MKNYILRMAFLTQASSHTLSAAEAISLLRFSPLMVRSQGKPVLHYQLPLGLWEGAPVHYHLLQGMILTTWRGAVVRQDAQDFMVRIVPAFRNIWADFVAHHHFTDSSSSVEIHDHYEFHSSDTTLMMAFAEATGIYQFDGRRWIARQESEAPTTAIESIPQSKTAG